MDWNFLLLGRMGVSKSTFEKISLSKLTSLTVESKPEVFFMAALSMRNFLGEKEVVDFLIIEVVLTVLL